MLKLQKIAITGTVSSGKSSVCQFFKELGAFVVNADAIVHEMLQNDASLREQIIRLLGPEILQDGQISRKKIAEKVFKDPKQLKDLEKVLHPAVLKQVESLYQQAADSGKYTLFVVEMPLLFEIEAESFYDATVAVIAEDALARSRFEKAGFAPGEYDRRMARQLSPCQKSKHADFTLTNNGSLDDLRRQVIALNQKMKQ